jgi:hypothetical protein
MGRCGDDAEPPLYTGWSLLRSSWEDMKKVESGAATQQRHPLSTGSRRGTRARIADLPVSAKQFA